MTSSLALIWWRSISSITRRFSVQNMHYDVVTYLMVSASGAVGSGLIPSRVKPITLKLLFTAYLLDAQHLGDCVKNNPASLIFVPLGNVFSGIFLSWSGRQTARSKLWPQIWYSQFSHLKTYPSKGIPSPLVCFCLVFAIDILVGPERVRLLT